MIAGLLLVPLSREGRDFIVFFRHGQLQQVHWAGNPYEKVKEMLRRALFHGKVLKCGVKLLSGNVAIGQMSNLRPQQYCIWCTESSSRYGDKRKRHFKALGWRRSCSTMVAMKVPILMSHFDLSPNPA
jgi:hypothetical protein